MTHRIVALTALTLAGAVALGAFAVAQTRPQKKPRASSPAQPAPTPPRVDMAAQLFMGYCAGCHGEKLTGSQTASLIDDLWSFGGDDDSLEVSIREGRIGTAMPPFKGMLNDTQIRALVIFIREQASKAKGKPPINPDPSGVVVKSERHTFRIETVAEGIETPWAIAFLPDGRMLVTERPGRLRTVQNGKVSEPVAGTPPVFLQQDGGLFDVEVHPDYARNGWIYLSYADAGPNKTSMTAVIRGRIRDGRWVDQESLYQPPPELYGPSPIHYGSRFLFDRQGHLFYSIGDRGRDRDAQDLSNPNGKIHRVQDDGKPARDNPFVGQPGALPSIWSYGNRNPQGLAFHPVTGKLWAVEHGPRGGDELNRIDAGANYGWPLITHGLHTTEGGTVIARTQQEGMQQPVTHWTPSIAPGAITFYTGDRFPNWKNDLFLAALAGQSLRRLVLDGDKVTHEEVLFNGFGRVRDVIVGPDGYLYVALNLPGVTLAQTTPGRIIRLVPVP